MSLSLIAVGAKITAAFLNALVGVANGIGSTLISPTSIAGTNVNVSALGKVSFAASPSVSINGCFNGSYDNYLVLLEITGASASTQVNIRSRSGGVDDAGTTYNYELGFDAASTHTAASATGQTSIQLTGGAAVVHSIRLDVRGPALASAAHFLAESASATPGALYVLSHTGGGHQVTSAFDGLTILPSVGGTTLTGTVRVYGYNNG